MGIFDSPKSTDKRHGVIKPKKLRNSYNERKNDRGILSKLNSFLSNYSLNNYENNIDVTNLQKSYYDIQSPKKARFESASSPLDENKSNWMKRNDQLNKQKEKDFQRQREIEIDFRKKESQKERLKQLQRYEVNQYEEIDSLRKENIELKSNNNHLLTTNHQANKQLQSITESYNRSQDLLHVKNEENKKLIQENQDLMKNLNQLSQELELVNKTNKSLIEENKTLKQDSIDHLELKIQLNSSNYLINLKMMEIEFMENNLIKNPTIKFQYYNEIHDKLIEYEMIFSNYKLFKQDKAYIMKNYNYETLIDWKIILNKLNNKLYENFQKRNNKNQGQSSQRSHFKVINYLSIIHNLRLKIYELLNIIDEILIILNA
ncbi:hypothetical protein CLIB1444_09S02828 [[Candida] jaroonii]|uniref:Uncharacterized protein n=1 Tax=[Candida] jaroonii TaxID=467808 RepID=A0ACA9YCD7_9ASCO|nr:hypothetical protein CLIB1444_09S02828 [[Candida] jaroonii]